MSYTYLFEICDLIDRRIEALSPVASCGEGVGERSSFLQGQLDALIELKRFLHTTFKPKLPGKARKQLQNSDG